MDGGGKEKNNKAHQVSSRAASAQHQDTSIIQPTENSENHSTEVTSRINTALQSPEGAILGSSSIASFENFNLMIDELLTDYKLPRHIKWGYYKLCCTQNAVLHAQLLKETNHILIAGIIIEIVGIADALRNCELSTFIDHQFPIWEKTIESFEHMGMNVGFLDAHLSRLQRIACDPKVVMYRQEYSQLSAENARMEDEMKSIQARLSAMEVVYNLRAAYIEDLQTKIANHEHKFQEQVSALYLELIPIKVRRINVRLLSLASFCKYP